MSEREPSILGQPEVARPSPAPSTVGGRPGSAGAPAGPAAARGARDLAPSFRVCGFWARAAAAAIDLAVVLPLCLVLGWIAAKLTGVHLPTARHQSLDFWLDLLLASDPALVGWLGLSTAIGLVYALIFQIATARTLGMRVLRLRIIDLYGDEPRTGRALARTAGYLACVATLGLGFVWIAFDSEKRGLHDYLAGTYVVKA